MKLFKVFLSAAGISITRFLDYTHKWHHSYLRGQGKTYLTRVNFLLSLPPPPPHSTSYVVPSSQFLTISHKHLPALKFDVYMLDKLIITFEAFNLCTKK